MPGELIVVFVPGVSEGQKNAVLARAGVKRKQKFAQIHADLVQAPDSDLADVAKRLAGDPRVRYVERNHVVSLLAVPDDPSFGQLWGLSNTGQTGGTPDADIDATEAWDVEKGSPDVVVAVSDTGVDFGHPDLARQQWINPGESCGSSDPAAVCAQRGNGVDDDGNGKVDDYRGWDFVSNDNDPFDDHAHGTHVSGTIGAVGNNAVGVAGVNWDVRIMALKFLDATGNGDTAGAIAATLYAADEGAAVSSNSWGGGPFDQALLDAIEYGADRGMLFVAAAGNDGANNDVTATYPANYASEAIVSVAATDHSDALAFFSNYGASTVDLAAPGVNILSTTPGATYSSFSGTSMATPHVSGVAALLKARFPDATPYGLKALLLGSVDSKASLAGRTTTGGRLNAATAVSCSAQPEAVLEAPLNGFKAPVGEAVEIAVLGSECATPVGPGGVSATVNGTPVALSASSPDSGLYRGSYTPTAAGALTVTAQVSAGGGTATRTAAGTADVNYQCVDITDSWVDATPGTRLATASSSDDGFSTLNIGFSFSFYGQAYTVAYVSSNGFLTLGSSNGATAFANAAMPNANAPNGVLAPFWDDLDPSAAGDVYAGITGSPGSRALHVEWFDVPHFSLFGSSGRGTFEMSLYEATGEVRLRYLDTDLGDAGWNAGASATAGVEKVDGSFGRQVSFNQPTLTNGRTVSCALGTPPPPPAPTVTTTTLDDATRTEAYAETLAATGGTPPYSWSLASGSLPPGVALAAGGELTGTPTATGSYSFTARVSDSLTQSDTQALTIAVADPLAVTTTSLSGGTVGQSYSQSVQATGGATPYSWSVASGSLPPGVVLSAGTGAITGTPTAAGTYPFTVQVSDSGAPARTDTQALSVVVAGNPPVISTSSLLDGTTGVAYGQTLVATGGSGAYTWSLDAGALPPGLALGPSDGTVTGTPTTVGSYAFTVRVTDGLSQFDTRSLSIVVAAPLVITTPSLPGGTAGQAYPTQTLAASGGKTPYVWSLSSGSLPPGLTLGSTTGVVSGTPTTAGTYAFTVRASDAGNPVRSATKPLSIAVAPASTLVITTASLPGGRMGVAYSASFAATGGVGPYTWARASGTLPPGLTLSAAGVLTGTPTKQGNYSFTVRVTDSVGTQRTKTFSLRIKR